MDQEQAQVIPPDPEIIRADSLIDSGDLATGVALYEGKIEQYLTEKNHARYLQLKVLLSKHLRGDRQYEEALALIEEAIPIGERDLAPEKDTLLADIYYEKGVIFYYIDEYPKAIEYLSKVLEIRERAYPAGHPDINTPTLLIGNCNLYSDQNKTAISIYKRLISTPTKISERLYTLALKNISHAYSDIGQIDLAEKYLRILLDRYDENDSSKLREIGLLYKILCGFEYKRQNFQEAIKHGNKAIDLYHRIDNSSTEDSLNLAKIINDIALAYEGIDSLEIAKHFYFKSLKILKHNEAATTLAYAYRYQNLAIVCQKLQQSDLALTYQHKALVIYKEKNFQTNIAGSYHNLGWILEESNQFKQSLEYHQQALLAAIPSFISDNIYELPQIKDIDSGNIKVIMYIAYKAKAFYRKYLYQKDKIDLHAAHQHYRLCLQLVQRSQKLFLFDDSKINLVSNSFDYFEDAIYVCFQLSKVENNKNYIEEAFAISEMSKSIALLESVLKLKSAQSTSIDNQPIHKEMQLRNAITIAEKAIYNERQNISPNDGEIKNLQASLLELYSSYDSLLLDLTKADSRISQIQREKRLDIHQLQRKLKTEQSLVSFFMGKKHSYAFALTKDTLHTYELSNDSTLQSMILRFSQKLRSFRNEEIDREFIDDFSELGYELYQRTLAPLSSFLKERVIIIPDGMLRLLPFEALLNQAVNLDKHPSFKQIPFLIKKHSISYHYSAVLLSELMSENDNKTKHVDNHVLAFAPRFQSNSRSTSSMQENRLRDIQLQPLYFNKQEIKAIDKIYTTKSFSNQSATKKNFEKYVKDFQIIHLASHAVINNDNPNYSFIAFNQDHDTLDLDNILYVNEIYELPIHAQLVVLSACQTAEGKLYAGEGMVSLARAFMYAGANSLLTTLWEINDAQSAYFMHSFYTYLKAGNPQDVALQKAKLAFINNYDAHPYYWSTFIQIGDSEFH